MTDTIYNARFKHIDELRRMGANVKVEGRSALINGKTMLQGAKVKASDLRAGAALVIAGLMADGITELTGLEHVDREGLLVIWAGSKRLSVWLNLLWKNTM